MPNLRELGDNFIPPYRGLANAFSLQTFQVRHFKRTMAFTGMSSAPITSQAVLA